MEWNRGISKSANPRLRFTTLRLLSLKENRKLTLVTRNIQDFQSFQNIASYKTGLNNEA